MLFGMLAHGADLGECVTLHGLPLLDHRMDQAHAAAASVSDRLRNAEIGEGGNQLPLVTVAHPDLVLFPARHGTSLDAIRNIPRRSPRRPTRDRYPIETLSGSGP